MNTHNGCTPGGCANCDEQREAEVTRYQLHRIDCYVAAYKLLARDEFSWEEKPNPSDVLAIAEFLAGDNIIGD